MIPGRSWNGCKSSPRLRRSSLSSEDAELVPTASEILEAARIKGRYPVSYADAFALAAAIQQKAALLTGDPELKALSNIVEIDWIGR